MFQFLGRKPCAQHPVRDAPSTWNKEEGVCGVWQGYRAAGVQALETRQKTGGRSCK